jgi:hypothetical protein
MLLFITDVKDILIIISVFCILSFQDSVSLQDFKTFDPNEPIVFTHDEPEFDGS